MAVHDSRPERARMTVPAADETIVEVRRSLEAEDYGWDDEGFEEEGEPDRNPPEPERVVLFSLDGRDYYVPAKVGPNVAMAYMRDIRRHGLEYARAGIMERMIGKEGLDALADFEGLTEEDLEAVMKAVDKHVLGPLEKSGKGSGFALRKSGG